MKWSFRFPISSRMKRGIPTGTEIQNAECTKTIFYAFARRMLAGPKYTCRQTRNTASQISCKTLSAKSKLLYAQNSDQSGERHRFAIKPSAKTLELDHLTPALPQAEVHCREDLCNYPMGRAPGT
jgi:hypothetical protein